MLRGLLIASVLIALVGTCLAADEPQGDIALGLGKLRWGMTLAEVRILYPFKKREWGGQSMTAYRYDGCSFEVFPEFTNDRLDSMILETFDRPASCYLQVRKELLAQYGKPDPAESRDNGKRLGWKTGSTLIWYIGGSGFLHIAFEQANGSPHHVIYDPAPAH